MCDVEAHVSELALLFLRFLGQSGNMHAFEARRYAFYRMKTVCQLANRKNVIFDHKAVVDSMYSQAACLR